MVDGNKGRIEILGYSRCANIGWLRGHHSGWEDLPDTGRVVSTCEVGVEAMVETRYFLSSLPPGAERFARAVRSLRSDYTGCRP